MIAARLVLAAAVLAGFAAAQTSDLLPEYNGNCVACTGPGYYCPLTTICYSSSSTCNSGCATTSCYTSTSDCSSGTSPSTSGLLPAYNGNCVACTGPGYYCPLTTICYSSSSSCSSGCAATSCYASTSSCSSGTSPSTAGLLPQYDGNCVACTGPGYYCPTTTLCYSSSTNCNSGCTATCYTGSSSCGSSPSTAGSLPAYNGNCIACTSAGYYCSSSRTCWSGSSTCSSNCGGSSCLAFNSQCSSSNSIPSYTWSASHSGATRTSFCSTCYTSALNTPSSVPSCSSVLYTSTVLSGTSWSVSFRFTGSNYDACNTGLWSAYSSSTARSSLSSQFVLQGYGTLLGMSRSTYDMSGLVVAVAALGLAIIIVIIVGVICCCVIIGAIIYCVACKKETTVVVQAAPTPMNQPYTGA